MEKITKEQFDDAIEYLKEFYEFVSDLNQRHKVDNNEEARYWLGGYLNGYLISYIWRFGYKTITITDMDSGEISNIEEKHNLIITKEDERKLWEDITTKLNQQE